MDKDVCFLEIAKTFSKRSHDSQTQHGCVLVKNDRIISTGFNGFPSGFPDDKLPNMRPGKYVYIIHSEVNAIINAAKNGISTNGAVAYITGRPCIECLKALIQAGVKKLCIGSIGHQTEKETQQLFDEMVGYAKIDVVHIEPPTSTNP